MIDLGRKEPDYSIAAATADKPKKTVIRYPSFSFTTDEAMDMPDGEFEATVKLRCKGGEWSEDESGKKNCTYRFEVLGMDPEEAGEEESEAEEPEDAAMAIMNSMQKKRSKKIAASDEE